MSRRLVKERKEPSMRTKVKALVDKWTFLDMINFRGGTKEFGKIHKELVDFDKDAPEGCRRDLVLMPRGHLKTTIMTVLNILHDIYVNPNIRLYVGSSGKPLARAIIREVTANLTDPWLQEFVWNARPHIEGRLIPLMDRLTKSRKNMLRESNLEYSEWDDSMLDELDVPEEEDLSRSKKVIWTQEAIQVLRPYYLKEPTLTVGSVDSAATGFHFDKLYFDDIINFDNYDKPEKIARLDTWRNDMLSVLDPSYFDEDLYDSLCNTSKTKEYRKVFHKLSTVGDSIVVVGTRYFRHDWYKQLLDDDESDYRFFVRNIYKNGTDNQGGYLWDERWDEKLETRIRKSMTRKHFYAQYLNEVIVTEEQILPFSQVKFIHASSIVTQPGSARIFINGIKDEPIEVMPVMCIDPAATCNKDSDFTACCVGGRDIDGTLYIFDIRAWKLPVDKWVREMYSLLDKWNLTGIHLETIGWAVTMKDTIRSYFKEYRPISIRDYKPTNKTSKKERIEAGLEPLLSNGLLYMTTWCKTSQEVQDQFNFFPSETVHDDVPDVIQMVNEVSPKTIPENMTQTKRKLNYNRQYGGVY